MRWEVRWKNRCLEGGHKNRESEEKQVMAAMKKTGEDTLPFQIKKINNV